MKTKHLILPIAVTAMLCVGCDKGDRSSSEDTSGVESYQEQDWSWEKQQGDEIQIDTVWDGDTTINF